MKQEKLAKLERLEDKWATFKKLRSFPAECKPGHKSYLTVIQRENLLDTVFKIIFKDP